jgi:hypothetical protein
VDGAKRIVPPLRGFTLLQYGLPPLTRWATLFRPWRGWIKIKIKIKIKRKRKRSPTLTQGRVGHPPKTPAKSKAKAPVGLRLMFGFAILQERAAVA